MKIDKTKVKSKRHIKLPNGFGSVVTLSNPETRRKPFQARTPHKMGKNGIRSFESLGYYETWMEAYNALVEYNQNPYDIDARKITFAEMYQKWYKAKYEGGKKKFSKSSMYCSQAAFKSVAALHDMKFSEIKTLHMQACLDDFTKSHASLEHTLTLFKQMFKYALQYDLVEKNYAEFLQINKEDDDKPGVPFTQDSLEKLWQNTNVPFVDTILILIYSGWRISELLTIQKSNIDLVERTMIGGVKTKASKNRVVPIHSKIYDFVTHRYHDDCESLIKYNNKPLLDKNIYIKHFKLALKKCKITTEHTPHDCRHTFSTLLDNAGANPVSIKRLMGHSTTDITEQVYTHKNVAELRKAIEMIK